MIYTEQADKIIKTCKELARDERKFKDMWKDEEDQKLKATIKKAYICMLKEYFMTLWANLDDYYEKGAEVEK